MFAGISGCLLALLVLAGFAGVNLAPYGGAYVVVWILLPALTGAIFGLWAVGVAISGRQPIAIPLIGLLSNLLICGATVLPQII